MYRVLARAVLLAAAVVPWNVEAQIHAARRPNVPARTIMGAHFRVPQSAPVGFRLMIPRPLLRHGLSVAPNSFPRHSRVSILFEYSCFTDALFDPFFCRQFFFPNRFLFAQPVLLPYPIYTAPYSPTEQTPAAEPDHVGEAEAGSAGEQPAKE